jgi:hypothetical protein
MPTLLERAGFEVIKGGVEHLPVDNNNEFELITAGIGNEVFDRQTFLEYRRLRSRVYVDQRCFLGPEHTAPDGGEILDDDDSRSIHICCIDSSPHPRALPAIGAMRIIMGGGAPLPVTNMFGSLDEIFGIENESSAIEISRFMANHPDPGTQGVVCAELIGEAIATSIRLNKRFLAVIERPFKLLMKKKGIVFLEGSGAAPRILEKYGNTENIAVEIDPVASLARALELDARTNRPDKIGEVWARRVGARMLEVA